MPSRSLQAVWSVGHWNGRGRICVVALPGIVLWLALSAGCGTRPLVPGAPGSTRPTDAATGDALARQVEVIRTGYGVPHVYAENLRALGYALGYLQLEDYSDRVPRGLLRARGELARYEGPEALDSDFDNRVSYLRAVERYPVLAHDTRDVYEGFATGVNRYIARHPEEFSAWMNAEFTGYDVAALYVYRPSARLVRRWTRRLMEADEPPLLDPVRNARPTADEPTGDTATWANPDEVHDVIDQGSSAWALAPSRTDSNAAILLRNPHLSWEAGYWEVHVVVPGRLDFYGDFRIGGPLGIIGGFNRHLGFATTNNDVDSTEVYALEVDPARSDHYLFDGDSMPIRREPLTRPFRSGEEQAVETRLRVATHLGPVLHQSHGRIYVLRAAEDGEFRGGEQFLRLIQATTFEEWTDAMRMRAHPRSNFIYADETGNIFYLWNAAIPVRPHPAGGTRAVAATSIDQVWTELHDLESLPQLLNPPGGYVRNENGGPWLTNLRQPLDPADYPAYFEGKDFGLRSQHAVGLIEGQARFSLEDVVRLKHSYRMLLADRVKDDLIASVRAAFAEGRLVSDTASALAVLERWDNTAAAESRGAVLFEEWWRTYTQALTRAFGPGTEIADAEDVSPTPFAEPWDAAAPMNTPRGLADAALAARLFPAAVQRTVRRFGSWDVA